MDKKGSRLVQPLSKGLTSDSKKSQDVTLGKFRPRGGRRREPAGGSLSVKSELSRKPNPQRSTKTFENKRPKPRGTFNTGSSVDRSATTRVGEDEESELDLIFEPGSRKQNLNHLLNFNYVSYAEEGRFRSDRNLKSTRTSVGRIPKYNKEHFLQANCQFIVNTLGDYKQHMNNPDVLVDWNFIEQVNVQVLEFPSCPICLYPPVAAKMTKCGHIYCWSCILHYLSLSDKLWRKCPICNDSIHKQDLKSVISVPHNTFNINDFITFKLMKRPKGSLNAYPASVQINDEDSIFNLSAKEANYVYSKLLLANETEILSIIEREYNELCTQMAENENCPESCFIEQALVLLQQRKDRLLERLKTTDNKMSVGDTLNLDCLQLTASTSQEPVKFHYFYQASDGQHIYLHGINAKMLEHTYGSLEKGPETLTGKILEKEEGIMTEEVRNRLRYLQHLPITCRFEVAEIQLQSPVVSQETVEHFSDQLKKRQHKRQRRIKEENKRERLLKEKENRLMGKRQEANIHLDSELQFPCFEARTITPPPSDTETLTSPSSSVETGYSGMSFAKMLSKKPEQKQWPSLKESSPSKVINVTGQKVSSPIRICKPRNCIEGEERETVASCSLGDAIEEALRRVEADNTSLVGKKKKKKKDKILYTTSMTYSGK